MNVTLPMKKKPHKKRIHIHYVHTLPSHIVRFITKSFFIVFTVLLVEGFLASVIGGVVGSDGLLTGDWGSVTQRTGLVSSRSVLTSNKSSSLVWADEVLSMLVTSKQLLYVEVSSSEDSKSSSTSCESQGDRSSSGVMNFDKLEFETVVNLFLLKCRRPWAKTRRLGLYLKQDSLLRTRAVGSCSQRNLVLSLTIISIHFNSYTF